MTFTPLPALRSLLLLSLALLSGCASLSPQTLWALSQFDPLNADPAAIAVAVGMQEQWQLRDGDAEMRFMFMLEGANSPAVNELFALHSAVAADGTTPPPLVGEVVYRVQIAAADHERLRLAQQRVRQFKADGLKGQGTLEIEVMGGCHHGPLPATLMVRTFIQTDPDVGFMPLSSQLDLFTELDETGLAELQSRLRPCT